MGTAQGYLGASGWAGWAVLGAGLGMLAGAAGRALLGRLRRGTTMPPPRCELAVGALWAAVAGAAAAGAVPWAWVPLLAGVGWLAVVAGVVDLRHHRLPDALTLPALPAAVALAVPLGAAATGRAAVGALLFAAAHLAVHAVAPAALGLGDVKLAAPVGAVLAAGSWAGLLLGAALIALVSGIAGVAVVVRDLAAVRRAGAEARRPAGGAVPAPVPAQASVSRAAAAPPAPGGDRWLGRLRRRELPLGPAMLGSTWVVAFVVAVGGGLPVGVVGGG